MTGGHVWAQRYDGTLEDIFGLQDRVTQQIVTALSVSLTVDEQAERTQTETENVTAYDAFMRGWELYRRGTAEDFAAAIPFLKDAVKLDPDYGRAYAALAAVYWNSMWNVWNRSLGLGQQQAVVLVQKYLREAKRHPSALAYQVASEYSAHYRPRPAKALSDAERAISLDANNPAGYLAMANALIKAKRPAEAVANMREAMRLDPHYPAFYLTRLGQAQFAMGRFQDAATTFERAAGRNPNDDWNFVYLAATYAHLERESEAKNAIAKANELRSSMNRAPVSLKELSNWFFRWTGDKESLRAGLVKAGAGHGRTEWTQLVTSGESGYEIDGATIIDVAAAKALHDRGVIFVDIDFMWLVEHIPGAHYIEEDTDEFVESELLQIVEKGQEVVIYGGDSRRAANASAMAVTWGFEKVYYFRDGTQGWKSAGYPLEGWKAE
jgi:tetratricopeptide (TPR) repeat protein